jgi:hypothetical protein
VAWEAVGSVFRAAAIRAAVGVTPAAAVAGIQAVVEAIQVVEVIQAEEEDIRLMAAKGDIPTTILAAVAARVR